MSMKLLTRADVKAGETADVHTIEFYALAFSKMPDKQGDRIDPKALDAWLVAFYKAGKPMPISFTHAAVRETSDPFNIVGYAPADLQHVWKDSYGLRVIAYLDTATNEKAMQTYSLAKRGIITGASVAYIAEREKAMPDGSTLILKMSVLESGLCLDPANDDAYLVAVKMAVDHAQVVSTDLQDDVEALVAQLALADLKAVDTATNEKAMQTYSLAKRGIITDAQRSAGQDHLEAHMAEISPDSAKTADSPEVKLSESLEAKAGRVLSSKNVAVVQQFSDLGQQVQDIGQQINDTAQQLLKSLSTEPAATAKDEEPQAKSEGPNAWLREAIASAQA